MESRPLATMLLGTVVLTAFTESRVRAEEKVVFETHVLPLFEARCIKCHGQGKIKAGLDLRRKFTMVKGGDSGPALVDGKPDESLLIQRIEKGEMPPPSEGKLDARQRDLLKRWIAGGALVARSPEPPLTDAEAVTQVTEEDRKFWAFVPPERPPVPKVKNAQRLRNPIDAFLLEKLEAKRLTFNPEAPRHVLLRRLTFDLLGLPPTPEQLAEFLADQRPDAYERLVDRLLAQPEYGERWGRHWLDLAGYADSDGYLAADRLRPEAWRYRDYVIQSLNEDVPYDRFLTEQLAGDEISDWRKAEKLTPDMIRQLTATGFLRTALDPTYPGYTEPNEIHQVLSDTMQIVGTTTMGLTLHCARCHGHKFDPISQRDYFAVQTILLPALDPARWQPSGVRGIPLTSDAEAARLRQEVKSVDVQLNKLNAALAQLTLDTRTKYIAAELPKVTKGLDRPVLEKLQAALLVDAKKRNPEQKALVTRHAPELSQRLSDLAKTLPDYKVRFDKLMAAIGVAQEQKKAKTPVTIRGLMDLDGKVPVGRVLRRGEYSKPGAEVEPGVPEVLTPVNFKFKPADAYKTTGRRLALARWLTDPKHPLTARVQVNRMWATHFGCGLVATVANFGRAGSTPSHPDLLDWLAVEFMQPSTSGDRKPAAWSMKHMHRLMVTSAAYRQTSAHDPAKATIDPKNTLLWSWRPQRHQGEVLRDSMLAVSGKLNAQRFGPPSPVAPKSDGSVETNDDPAGNRRSIYLIVRRSQHLTLLEMFDTPLMEVNCPERTVSTVPLQALAMLHGPFSERNARALADRLLQAEPKDEAARVRLAYRLLFSREPSASEMQRIQRTVAALQAENSGPNAVRAAWSEIALVLLNSNEFVYVP